MTITMTTTKKVLKEGTKTVYEVVETTTQTITAEMYKNIINARWFFKSMGGTERHKKGHTCNGLQVVRIMTTNPNHKEKYERIFKFA